MANALVLKDLWRETFVAGRAGMSIYLPIAAAFVLLPAVLIDSFGPPQPRTAAELTGNAVLIYLLLPSLIGLVAQATIVRLALDAGNGASRTAGEALAMALRMWPIAVLATLLAAVPTGAGMLLLIVPGLYLAGRLAMALPLVVEAGTSPVDAVRRSWILTAGNGWRIIAFILLWIVWFVALSVLVAGVGGAIASVLAVAGAKSIGVIVVSALGGLVSAVFTVFQAVGLATLYRHLTAQG